MQINLFEDQSLMRSNFRTTKQIKTRNFEFASSFDRLKDEVEKKLPGNKYNEIKNEIYNSIDQDRIYTDLGRSSCDNKFYLEALGVGKYVQGYILIIDFSDKLDYILHRLTKCKSENIRKMDDYYRISYAFLNLKSQLCPNINYDVFCGLDPELDKYMADLHTEISEKYYDYSNEEILQEFIYTFYSNVLSELESVKTYVITYLKKLLPSLVYRSKSFSSVLGTLDSDYNESLELIQNGNEDCIVEAKCYKRFEYLDEIRRYYEFIR